MKTRRTWAMVSISAVMAILISACTADGKDGVPTAGGVPSATRPAGEHPEAKFVACMRAAGVEISDPIPGDTSGRSAVKHAIDVMGKGGDAKFQTALDACMALLPQLAAPTVDPGDADKLLLLARCMRENGVTDFPDPVPGQPNWIMWKEDDPAWAKAYAACSKLMPNND